MLIVAHMARTSVAAQRLHHVADHIGADRCIGHWILALDDLGDYLSFGVTQAHGAVEAEGGIVGGVEGTTGVAGWCVLTTQGSLRRSFCLIRRAAHAISLRIRLVTITGSRLP